MIELHYNEGEQQELFPLSNNVGQDSQPQEWFPVIDEQGNVVGRATRQHCHSGSMTLHPVVHLHVLDANGRIYLQKRSMRKDIAPGRWDTSVGGHVDYGESLQAAVVREAREELGLHIDVGQCRFLFQYIWQSSRERELVTAFALTTEAEPQPDHDEVDEGRYFTIEQLQNYVGQGFYTSQFEQQELPRLIEAMQQG